MCKSHVSRHQGGVPATHLLAKCSACSQTISTDTCLNSQAVKKPCPTHFIFNLQFQGEGEISLPFPFLIRYTSVLPVHDPRRLRNSRVQEVATNPVHEPGSIQNRTMPFVCSMILHWQAVKNLPKAKVRRDLCCLVTWQCKSFPVSIQPLTLPHDFKWVTASAWYQYLHSSPKARKEAVKS